MKPRRWHEVPVSELKAIWRAQRRAGFDFNGSTDAALVKRYGAANVRHRPGHGWYKLVAKP